MKAPSTPPVFDPSWVEFDHLSEQMRELHERSVSAPVEHVPFHELALTASYTKAHEFLAEHPEVIHIIRSLGSAAIKHSGQTENEKASLRQLRNEVHNDLVRTIDLKSLVPTIAEALKPDESEMQAFENLFGDILPLQLVREAEEDMSDMETPVDEIEDEINTLDILELIEMYDLTAPELAVVKRCLGSYPISFDDLRREEWDIINLPKAQFDSLVRDFPFLKSKVLEIFAEAKIPAKWQNFKARKTASFQLLVGKDAEPKLKDGASGVEQILGHKVAAFGKEREISPVRKQRMDTSQIVGEKTKEEVAAMFFAAKLLAFMKSNIQYNEGEVKASSLARDVAAALKIPRPEARELVKAFVASEDVFYSGSQDGTRLVSLTKPVGEVKKAKQNVNKVVYKQEQMALGDAEITTSIAIFDTLAENHVQKGDTMGGLRRLVGDSLQEEVFNRLVRKLSTSGYLTLYANRSRGGRARKGLMVTLTDQALKDRWQSARPEIVSELKQIGRVTE